VIAHDIIDRVEERGFLRLGASTSGRTAEEADEMLTEGFGRAVDEARRERQEAMGRELAATPLSDEEVRWLDADLVDGWD
jgi:hypothetical protein